MKLIAATLIALTTFTMNAQNHPKPSVDVTGTGLVKIVPDQVGITVRVENEGPNAKEVKQRNDQTVNNIFQFLKKAGIDEKQVKTEYLNLNKNYDYNTKTYRFVANQTISILLKDLKNYEPIMNGLLETGINRIDGVTFISSKRAQLESEARIKAIQDAKQKAQEYAGTLGQTIGKALLISEFQNNSGPGPMYKMMSAAPPSDSVQTMAPGEMEISVNVNVSFELN